jgi:Putative metal-binding motif
MAGGTAGQGGLQGGVDPVRAASGVSAGRLRTDTAPLNSSADFDKDGVTDRVDDCVEVPGAAASNGCPVRPARLHDADGDDIPDTSDRCPTVRRGTNDADEDGCPDPPPPPRDDDRDGFFADQDCNDANAAIHPGAVEIRGNGVDENCDGVDEPLPTITSAVSSNWSVKGKRVTLLVLQARRPPAGASGEIRCLGKRCPFKRKSVATRRGKIDFLRALARRERRFRAGQTIEVRVTAPGFVGKVLRYKLRKGRLPTARVLCLPPGGSRPQPRC